MPACKNGGNRTRRAALLLACLAIPFSIFSTASAQEWPARNVTFVVPLGAGSASDIMARVVADQMGRQLNRTFVVENRPGAGGTIGAAAVARAAPDGYTVLAYGALATANALYSKLAYDTLNDFVPVIAFGIQPLVIVSSPEKGYKTLADLIAAGKAKPGSLNYSSAGAGSASHFAGERLRVSAGIQAQHVTYKGAAEAVTEVVAGPRTRSIRSTAACSCRRRRRATSWTGCTRKPPRRYRHRRCRRDLPSSVSNRCR